MWCFYENESAETLEFVVGLVHDGQRIKLNAKGPVRYYAPGLAMEFLFIKEGNSILLEQYSPYAKIADFKKVK